MTRLARRTDLTDEQCVAISNAREMLQPLFPGQIVRLSLPKMMPAARAQRHDRIAEAILSGSNLCEIARHERVSVRLVRMIRAKVKAGSWVKSGNY